MRRGLLWTIATRVAALALVLTRCHQLLGLHGQNSQYLDILLHAVHVERVESTCWVTIPNDERIQLPNGGLVYRLGGVSLETGDAESLVPTAAWKQPRKRQYLTVSGKSEALWDLLWTDYHGVFDQKKPANSDTLIIPWREPHRPIFLVMYPVGGGSIQAGVRIDFSSTVVVRYVEEVYGAMNASVGTAAHCTAAADPAAHEDNTTGTTFNNEEAFRYPIRQPFFRTRLNSTIGLVTICSQLTVDRLSNLELCARAYGGPVSAVVYVGFKGNATQDVEVVARFWDDCLTDEVRQFVDIHLVYDVKKPWFATGLEESTHGHNPYPVNLLRQYSVDMARTEWVLVVEADMLTPLNAHEIIHKRWHEMMTFYNRTGRGTAFVVPLYNLAEQMGLEKVPASKRELVSSLRNGSTKIKPFARLNPHHRKLDHEGWEGLPGDDASFLLFNKLGSNETCMHRQEPYYIVRKEDMPPWNVLFAGMIYDKINHVGDMCSCGFVFHLHPDIFLLNFHEPSDAEGWLSARRKASWRQQFVLDTTHVYREEFQLAQQSILGRKRYSSFPCSKKVEFKILT